MTNALVIGASGGIGSALVQVLKNRGDHVLSLSRSADGLDIRNEASVEEHIGAIDVPLDMVIVATGALTHSQSGPEKTLKALDAESAAKQFELNAIGPMLVLKHVIPLMQRENRCVFAALSARVGSIGDNRLGGWYSYRASKAALNQFIHTASIEIARTHKSSICVALHPGTVETNFTSNYRSHDMVPPDEAASNLINVLDDLSPDDTGQFFDWQGAQVQW